MKNMPVGEAVDEVNGYLLGESTRPYFVVIDGTSEYVEFLSHFFLLSTIRTSNYCDGDSFPDYGRLENDLHRLARDSLLIGLGDSVYLGGNASILGRIKDMYYSHKLVVICRKIRKEIRSLAENDNKFNAYHVCGVDSIGGYTITQVTSELTIEADAADFKTLLAELEKGGKSEFVVQSAIELRHVYKISAPFEYVRYRNPSFSMEKTCLKEAQWRELADGSANSSEYDCLHWRSYVDELQNPGKNPYMKFVVARSNTALEYADNVIYGLLLISVEDKDFWQLYHARKDLLKTLKGYDFSEYVNQTRKMDFERIYYLTDQSEVERKAVLEEIARLGTVPQEIFQIYPAVTAYLQNYAFAGKNGEIFSEYFREYKRLKLYDRLSDDFRKQVEELARTGKRSYTAVRTRGELLERYDKEEDALFWLDGLGVEFLGYIQQRARDLDLSIHIQAGRCELPSLTCFNRDFYDSWSEANRKMTRKLDDIKHDGERIHLDDELAVIDEQLEWIKNRLASKKNRRVILTSDHGASRLAVIHNKENKWDMATKGEHSGRCCPSNEIDGRPDCATEEREFWVLANYDRFKGGRKASVEVHGGAALEEILVPVIEISLKNTAIDIQNLTPETESDNAETVPEIVLFSSYELKNVSVYFNEKFYRATIDNENPHKHHVRFEDYRKSGMYAADVYEADDYIGKIEFQIHRKSGKARGFEFFGM